MTMLIGAQREICTCRGCGCTDDNACITEHGPCAWVLLDVETLTGVCSACAQDVDWDPEALMLLWCDNAERAVQAAVRRTGT